MSSGERVVAVGLLTERDLTVLGQGFQRIFRLDEQHDFHALLQAIDDAERCHDRACTQVIRPIPSAY